MTPAKRAEKPSPHIEVAPATRDQEPILANLIELYMHDFTEFHEVEIGEDGRFGYRHLPLYWQEEGRHPFLVLVDRRIAGFALVKKWSEISGDANVWDMAEFFILRGCRRRGIGASAAHEVWRRFPGRWEVRVMEANLDAHKFWERAISTFAGGAVRSNRVEREGGDWLVFSFEAKR